MIKHFKQSFLSLALAATICISFSLSAKAQNVDVVGSFSGSYSPSGAGGSVPIGTLVQDATQGNIFYGVTEYGGSVTEGSACNVGSAPGCGTLYMIDINNGEITVLHNFTGMGDGANPSSSLQLDAQGNLYGTTNQAYPTSSIRGTVFKYSLTNKTFDNIATFTGTANDGANPRGNIILNADGTIVGATSSGGTAGLGTIYELVPQGDNVSYSKSIVYNFSGPDGNSPLGGVALYGDGYAVTTYAGGFPGCGDGGIGCGTLIVLLPTSSNWTSNILHVFKGTASKDGADPVSAPLVDTDGNLYVETSTGGIGCKGEDPENAGCGTVAKFAAGMGTETILHAFSKPGFGASPNSLTFGPNGSLIGTFEGGGTFSTSCHSVADAKCGVVYQLSPTKSGKYAFTQLHYFTGSPDGSFPSGLTPYTMPGVESPASYLITTQAGGVTPASYCGPSNARRATPCGAIESLTVSP